MILPREFVESIESLTDGFPGRDLTQAAEGLARAYRGGRPPRRLTPLMAAAYCAVRLPSTWSAVAAALTALENRWPGVLQSISTATDVGTGPGTVPLALHSIAPRSRVWHAVEQDGAMAEMARSLVNRSPEISLTVHSAAVEGIGPIPSAELVTAAYCLNELSPGALDRAVASMMSACRGLILIVEPGSPLGALTVGRVRSALLAAGWQLLAPCPHQGPCPLDPLASNDESAHSWCHFSVRISRTGLMRRIKGATAAYEDEPYCYLVARPPDASWDGFPDCPAGPPGQARLLDSPRLTRTGAAYRVCADNGNVMSRQVSGRDRETLRRVRRLDRGDLELSPQPEMRD